MKRDITKKMSELIIARIPIQLSNRLLEYEVQHNVKTSEIIRKALESFLIDNKNFVKRLENNRDLVETSYSDGYHDCCSDNDLVNYQKLEEHYIELEKFANNYYINVLEYQRKLSNESNTNL